MVFDQKVGPGQYPAVPDNEYHAAEMPDNSCLSDMLVSPAHCRWNLDHGREPTPSMKLGTALHLLVLEPDAFNGRYCAAPGCEASTKNGKRCSRTASVCREGEWFCSQHDSGGDTLDGPEIVDNKFLETVWGMKESLYANKQIRPLLEGDWPREMSVVFNDPDTEIKCKARIDLMRPDLGALIDLKTVRYGGAAERMFAHSVYRFGYHRQAAFYLHALGCLDQAQYSDFGWIVVETEPPYACTFRELGARALELGREHVLPLLEKYADCDEAGEWPAYPISDDPLEFSPWMTNQITDDILSLFDP